MKRNYLVVLTFLAVVLCGAETYSAQFTITIPKWPKINKPKTEPPREVQTTTVSTQSKDTQEPESKPAATKDRCSQSGWLDIHLGKIAERQAEVSSFTPDRGWFTRDFTYDHLLYAVSPSAREKWLKDSNALDLKACPNLVSAFDKLAAAAAEKFPLYTANPKAYNIRNPAEEKKDDFEKRGRAQDPQDRAEPSQLADQQERIRPANVALQTRIHLVSRSGRRPSILPFLLCQHPSGLRRRGHVWRELCAVCRGWFSRLPGRAVMGGQL